MKLLIKNLPVNAISKKVFLKNITRPDQWINTTRASSQDGKRPMSVPVTQRRNSVEKNSSSLLCPPKSVPSRCFRYVSGLPELNKKRSFSCISSYKTRLFDRMFDHGLETDFRYLSRIQTIFDRWFGIKSKELKKQPTKRFSNHLFKKTRKSISEDSIFFKKQVGKMNGNTTARSQKSEPHILQSYRKASSSSSITKFLKREINKTKLGIEKLIKINMKVREKMRPSAQFLNPKTAVTRLSKSLTSLVVQKLKETTANVLRKSVSCLNVKADKMLKFLGTTSRKTCDVSTTDGKIKETIVKTLSKKIENFPLAAKKKGHATTKFPSQKCVIEDHRQKLNHGYVAIENLMKLSEQEKVVIKQICNESMRKGRERARLSTTKKEHVKEPPDNKTTTPKKQSLNKGKHSKNSSSSVEGKTNALSTKRQALNQLKDLAYARSPSAISLKSRAPPPSLSSYYDPPVTGLDVLNAQLLCSNIFCSAPSRPHRVKKLIKGGKPLDDPCSSDLNILGMVIEGTKMQNSMSILTCTFSNDAKKSKTDSTSSKKEQFPKSVTKTRRKIDCPTPTCPIIPPKVACSSKIPKRRKTKPVEPKSADAKPNASVPKCTSCKIPSSDLPGLKIVKNPKHCPKASLETSNECSSKICPFCKDPIEVGEKCLKCLNFKKVYSNVSRLINKPVKSNFKSSTCTAKDAKIEIAPMFAPIAQKEPPLPKEETLRYEPKIKFKAKAAVFNPPVEKKVENKEVSSPASTANRSSRSSVYVPPKSKPCIFEHELPLQPASVPPAIQNMIKQQQKDKFDARKIKGDLKHVPWEAVPININEKNLPCDKFQNVKKMRKQRQQDAAANLQDSSLLKRSKNYFDIFKKIITSEDDGKKKTSQHKEKKKSSNVASQKNVKKKEGE